MASAQALSKPQRIKEGLGKVLSFLNWHSRTSNPSSTWHLLPKNSKNDCWETLVISHEKEQFVPKVTVLDGIQNISVLCFSSAAASGISVSTSFGGSPVGKPLFRKIILAYEGTLGFERKQISSTSSISKMKEIKGSLGLPLPHLPSRMKSSPAPSEEFSEQLKTAVNYF